MPRHRAQMKWKKLNPPSGEKFSPAPHRGAWIYAAIGAGLLAAAVALAIFSARQPVSMAQFWRLLAVLVLGVLAMVMLYRAVALAMLRFHITRNGLTIRWGATLHRIPMDAIRGVTRAPALPNCTLLGVTLPRWWVCRRENMWLFATGGAADSVVVKTTSAEIYLSPNSVNAFIAAWKKRVPLGETQFWDDTVERRGLLAYPLWFDRTARYLGLAAIALSLILTGAVFTAFNSLPPAIPLPTGTAGVSVAIASRQQLLWIPYSGAIVTLINLLLGAILFKRARLAAYLLFFAAMLLQVGLWFGFRLIVG